MDQRTLIIGGLVLAAAGAGAWYYFNQKEGGGATIYTIQGPNGQTITGTAEELVAQGYVAINQAGELKWVTQEAYNQAAQQSGGNPQLFANILAALGAIFTVVQSVNQSGWNMFGGGGSSNA